MITYPKLGIRSKYELAKRISDRKFPYEKAINLINDVLINFDRYWKDNLEHSNIEKGKFVRSAAGSPLGILLKKISEKVLKPHDHLVPDFIFGGISSRNHIQASQALLGKKKHRTLMKLDLSTFFEQITYERVSKLLHIKCNCSLEVANLLAKICCIPLGAKGSSGNLILARGFSTSPRLAVWTNLGTFMRLKWQANKLLYHHDPRMVIFVDDIGVSASKISEEVANHIVFKLKTLLEKQALKVNGNKTKIVDFKYGAEHLGLRLGRDKLSIGKKTYNKIKIVKEKLSKAGGVDKKILLQKLKSYLRYKNHIKHALSLTRK